MARGDLIAVGLVLMLFVAPLLGVLGLIFFFLGGFLLIAFAWLLGITGFVLFIYGLVAHSDLERAALTRPPVIVTQPPVAPPLQSLEVSGKYCMHCGRFNPLEARFCTACGQSFVPEAGGIPR